MVAKDASIPLEESLAVELDGIADDQRSDRAILSNPHDRAKLDDFLFANALQLGEGRDSRIESIEGGQFLVARMDKRLLPVTERNIGKSVRRALDERATRKRQRADERVAECVMEHRRASP
jgi:hypothetical protein